MHHSHKVWITLAVFIVVVAFLAAMFFSVSPKEMTAFAKQQQELKRKKDLAQQEGIEFKKEVQLAMGAVEKAKEKIAGDEAKYNQIEKEAE